MSEPRTRVPLPGYLHDPFAYWLAANLPLVEGIIKPGAFDGVMLTVSKHAAHITVPDKLLMHYGVIEDTRPPREPVKWPWRTRLHWRISDLRERAAIRAYCVISGDDFPDDEW